MASKLNCAGCFNAIKKGKQHLKCIACNGAYDLACAGVSEQRFNSFYGATSSKGSKREWNCPACVNKRPKGDHTDTPVRKDILPHDIAADEDSLSGEPDELDNVTLRHKTNATPIATDDNDFLIKIQKLIKQEIRAALRVELVPINEKLNDLQNSVQYVSNQYDDLIKTTSKIMDDYKSLQSECEVLRATVDNLSERLNNMEQQARDANVEIHGVPYHRSENVVEIVSKIAEVVSHKLNDIDILKCTRVASINKDNKRPRSIIVKLRSSRSRDDFYSAVTRYNRSHPKNKLCSSLLGIVGDNSPVYVSEHLSPANKALHSATRTRCRELSYKFVWVRNGRIFARKNETSPFIFVKNRQVLDTLQ